MDLDYLQSLMGGDEVAEEAGGYQDIWVVGETSAGELSPLTAALIAKARELANGLGAYVKGILFGPDSQPAGERMIQFGADSVVLFDAPALAGFGLEPFAEALASAIETERPEMVLFGATSLGGELAPCLAARFGGPCFTHCIDLGIDEMQRALLATVPRLAGEYYEILASPTARPQFATIEDGVLPQPYADEYRFGDVASAELPDLPPARVQQVGVYEGERASASLEDAEVIVCLGRGLLDEEGVRLAGELAGALEMGRLPAHVGPSTRDGLTQTVWWVWGASACGRRFTWPAASPVRFSTSWAWSGPATWWRSPTIRTPR